MIKSAVVIAAILASLTSQAHASVPDTINAGGMNVTGAAPLFLLDNGTIEAGSMNIRGAAPLFLLDNGTIEAGSMNITSAAPLFLLDNGAIEAGSMNIRGAAPLFLLDNGTIEAGSMNITGTAPQFMLDNEIDAGEMLIKGAVLANQQQTPAMPAIEPPKAEMGKLPPKPTQQPMDRSFVSIKLLSVKPHSGINPFAVKDIRTLDAPSAAPPKDAGTNTPAPQTAPSQPSRPSENPAPSAAPALRATAPAASGFSCAGKPDGNYCKDSTTLVFCYHDSIANAQTCPSGCDATHNACSAYKP